MSATRAARIVRSADRAEHLVLANTGNSDLREIDSPDIIKARLCACENLSIRYKRAARLLLQPLFCVFDRGPYYSAANSPQKDKKQSEES